MRRYFQHPLLNLSLVTRVISSPFEGGVNKHRFSADTSVWVRTLALM